MDKIKVYLSDGVSYLAIDKVWFAELAKYNANIRAISINENGSCSDSELADAILEDVTKAQATGSDNITQLVIDKLTALELAAQKNPKAKLLISVDSNDILTYDEDQHIFDIWAGDKSLVGSADFACAMVAIESYLAGINAALSI